LAFAKQRVREATLLAAGETQPLGDRAAQLLGDRAARPPEAEPFSAAGSLPTAGSLQRASMPGRCAGEEALASASGSGRRGQERAEKGCSGPARQQSSLGTDVAERSAAISTGVPALDALLPRGGLARGSLTEWLGDESGTLLAALAAVQALAGWPGRYLVVVEHAGGEGVARAVSQEGRGGRALPGEAAPGHRPRVGSAERPRRLPSAPTAGGLRLYPPAAAAWGLPLDATAWLRVTTVRDEFWAVDQALRSPSVAAVVAWPRRVDDRTFRRWQLAAESSGALGLLCRPTAARADPSWADARWSVRWAQPLPAATLGTWSWRLEARCLSFSPRGASRGVTCQLRGGRLEALEAKA
jgi:hypothetical protein